MQHTDLKEQAFQLINTVPNAVLTTIDDVGFPFSRAVCNLRDKKQFPDLQPFFEQQDDFVQYITTDTSSEKMAQIKANPKISLYYCDAQAWHGSMLGGEMEIIEDSSIKEALWQKDWTQYYPKGLIDSEYAILRLRPSIARGWHWKSAFTFDPEVQS